MTAREWIETGGYERMRVILTRFERNRKSDLDEDIYHDTLTKMLAKDTYSDPTQRGYDNYCFMAYRINVMREMQYPRRARTTYVEDMTPYQSPEEDGDIWWIYDAVEREFGEEGVGRLLDGDDEIMNWLRENMY